MNVASSAATGGDPLAVTDQMSAELGNPECRTTANLHRWGSARIRVEEQHVEAKRVPWRDVVVFTVLAYVIAWAVWAPL